MRLLTRRLEDTSSVEDQPTESAPVAWTGPAAWITKTVTGSLLACLVAGPVGLLLAGWVLWNSATMPLSTPVVSSEAETIDERSAVEAFAADFVVTWLTTTTGQEKRLAPYMVSHSGLTLPETSWLVRDAAPAGIVTSPTLPGGWSVTIAATVSESDQSAATRRYFRVPVVYADGALVAQALPAPVAGPALAAAPKLDYRYRAGLDDPVAAAAQEFLDALLVGGDVTRFISPSAPIRAVTPAPYTAVAVDDVQVDEDLTDSDVAAPVDGDQLQLLVTATVTPTAKAGVLTVQYALTVTARAGRWEISSVDAGPAVNETGTSPAADPTTHAESSTN
ncbi:MAG: conjugal transfer protein [Nocardioides sp.]